jgi:hypothetical protein
MCIIIQAVFIDESSSYWSSHGCGWMFDDSTSGGIHIIASCLLRSGGTNNFGFSSDMISR